MRRRNRKYVLDTQLFIRGFREPGANEALQEFHRSFAPFEYMSAVVAQELRSGAPATRERSSAHVLNGFERTRRLIAPSVEAGTSPGVVLAEMAREEGLQLSRVSKAFGNDILLTLSGRGAGSAGSRET